MWVVGHLFPLPKDPKVKQKEKTAPLSQSEGRTILSLPLLPGYQPWSPPNVGSQGLTMVS